MYKLRFKWAYSKSVLRFHGMEEGRVRFPVGPPKAIFRTLLIMSETIFKKDFYRQQEESGWCGPAVIQMALAVGRIDKSQKDIAQDVYLSWWGTTHETMFAYLSRFFGDVDFKENASLEDIKQHIRDGQIVIVNWWDDIGASETNPEDGHYSLAVNYDDQASNLSLADPSSGRGIWQISQSDFEKRWYDFIDVKRKKKISGWMLWADPATAI